MSLTRQVEEFREENTINSKERLTLDPNTTRKAPATGPNSIIQAEQAMQQAAQQAKDEDHDPSRMLRVLAVLAAPVFDPEDPEHLPDHLDLHQEWHVLAEGVRGSHAPILLARLQPPTLESPRSALSPRATQAWECSGES